MRCLLIISLLFGITFSYAADNSAPSTFAASSLLPPPASSSSANICQILNRHPGWIKDAKKSQDRWGIPVYVQLAIIHTESAFQAYAKNRASTAYGFAQALNQTWRNYQRRTGQYASIRSSFAAATDFIGWYSALAHEELGIAKNNAYGLYMVYHDGAIGYKQRRWSTSRLAKTVQKIAERYKSQLTQC